MIKSVIIVEDVREFSSELVASLQKAADAAGATVEICVAETAFDALNHLKSRKFDLISLDGQFPRVEGGPILKSGGIDLLSNLEDLGHVGRVMFYSGDSVQVKIAEKFSVAGKPVQARFKGISDPVERAVWAELCLELLTE